MLHEFGYCLSLLGITEDSGETEHCRMMPNTIGA
jgi:hypothetical protein